MSRFPERASSAPPQETKNNVEKLVGFIASVAADYRQTLGLPVGDDGRINMLAYKTLYGDVESDVGRTRGHMKEWYGDISEEQANKERLKTDGEKLEMLALSILYKNLTPRFVVMRASRHDDEVNNVDTILFDRETGNLVCAFDEVGDTSGGVDYERKQAAVRKRNIESKGAKLKYGIRLEEREGKNVIAQGEASHIPLFYIALSKDIIEKGVSEFIPSQNEQSDSEKKLFEYFITAISLQIQGLEFYSGRLDDSLKQRLASFKKIVEGLERTEKQGMTRGEQSGTIDTVK